MSLPALPRYTFHHYRRRCCKCKDWRTMAGGKMRKVRASGRGAVTEFTCRGCV